MLKYLKRVDDDLVTESDCSTSSPQQKCHTRELADLQREKQNLQKVTHSFSFFTLSGDDGERMLPISV